MYSVDASDAQVLLGYSDVFSGKLPDLNEEIGKLNMHKSVSIICELIRIRDAMLEPVKTIVGEFSIPFETALKKQMCGINAESPEEMFSNPLLRKDRHIISVQMLLILLKKLIKYGKYETMDDVEYEIIEDDYRKIIQLQLVVAEVVAQQHLKGFDANHFLYSTYHLNYQRNLAHEFLRMYYMMERASRDKSQFDVDIQKEYRDYYTMFTEKYGFTPTQYSSLLFGELITYYSDINGLIYTSMWKNIEDTYGQVKEKDLISQVITTLAQPINKYFNWITETENLEWDFSKFFEFPFIKDGLGKYISISDITLRNAFFEKVFWLIRDCYPQSDSRAMAFFGRLFEKYIQDITSDAVNLDYEYIPEFSFKSGKKKRKSSDAYIRKGTNLLVVEAKGFSVLMDCMTKNEKMDKNNDKLFVEPILQADLCLASVIDEKAEFEGVEIAYIIAVTMDNINAVPDYYNEIHKKINNEKKCQKAKYYYNLSIEEYEMLMYLSEQKKYVFSLLKDYYNNERLKPFSNYLHERYANITMTKFMENLYHEASVVMKEMFLAE